jgi:hypothetical protein
MGSAGLISSFLGNSLIEALDSILGGALNTDGVTSFLGASLGASCGFVN